MMAFAPGLDMWRDEQLDDKWFLVEWIAHFISKENMQSFAASSSTTGGRLHRNSYFRCISLSRKL